MRIQHNIMAMNAYRNYNTNTSALSKNLEKLSSGYKINRAGDDAAGLAISEKMRAQITGLNAAQKNVKDGISLVKTAEGAMQEIQDMLNRMDYLATQSANGTYDDPVDRYNLQKEVKQLRSEINRIADSANFNGIKLLDGSLDVKATGIGATEAEAGTVTSLVSSAVGSTLGTNTILHGEGVEAAETEFGVDLHELKFSNKTNETLTLKIGGNTFTLDGDDNGEMTAADIAQAFENGKFKDANGNTVTATAVGLTDGTNTGTFSVEAKDNRLVFTQAAGEDPVNGDMNVDITGTGAGAGGTAAKEAIYSFQVTAGATVADGDTITVGGQTISVVDAGTGDITSTDAADATKLAAVIAAKLDGNVDTDYDITADGDKIVYTAKTAGAVGGATAGVPANAPTALTGDKGVTFGAMATDQAGADAVPGAGGDPSVTGDYNKTTTVTKQGVEEAPGKIASGVATLNKDTFADGSIIKIGDKEYTVTADAAKKGAADTVYVGDLNLDDAAGLKTAIDRLSVAADSNSVWTIGHGATAGEITFVEKVNAEGKSYTDLNTENGKLKDGAFDLSKESVIKETFGTVSGKKEATAGENGKALILQIGDTSDKFNQLNVGVGNMHVSAMGIMNTDEDGAPNGVKLGEDGKALSIENIDISSRDGASNAIDVIKAAINYVSGIRGDLGATQNRLEHTANNLSVMAENIQDAESTIRDTDVAEEMMAYTKNNILVQSAQAMLAQANAVPQGVLQLLG